MHFQRRQWDSDFFEVEVATIIDADLDELRLRQTIDELKQHRFRLVYWPASHPIEPSLADELGGKLVDRKATFVVDFQLLQRSHLLPLEIVKPYAESMSTDELEELAIQSGELSRFAVDSHIPRQKFVELYRIWIKRSIRKEMAREVLTIPIENRIAGMVTLGDKDGRGDIGLLAVDRHFRGRQFGEMLVQAAQEWFIQHGYQTGQVVTQADNIPACRLYEKCGYVLERVEYYYHFWI